MSAERTYCVRWYGAGVGDLVAFADDVWDRAATDQLATEMRARGIASAHVAVWGMSERPR